MTSITPIVLRVGSILDSNFEILRNKRVLYTGISFTEERVTVTNLTYASGLLILHCSNGTLTRLHYNPTTMEIVLITNGTPQTDAKNLFGITRLFLIDIPINPGAQSSRDIVSILGQ